MTSRLPLSVFIIAVNEGDRIGRTIASVRDWADEVIVIDSGSNDDTVAVSQAAGARALYNPWPGYGRQKRFGEEQCRNDWLLNLDADEVISQELAQEIQALFAQGVPKQAGYWMDIVEILPGRRRPDWRSHRVRAIRLYDRRSGRFDESTVHDSVRMSPGAGIVTLAGIIEHRSSRGIAHTIDKINRYSTMQAADMLKRGLPSLLALRIVFELPVGFFKAYMLRGYFLHGFYGFINAVNYGYSRFARLAKAWEGKQR
ncbi:MAG: glycosyltransferase family 2 protein [Pseudomonadota bacterium]|nr:glycosyltransferase family 2 protein [Pseudomonadota bacterium]